jgi:NAD(P)-dependent dehydrogenase (short-subunit alcohol dehydrogenase family)
MHRRRNEIECFFDDLVSAFGRPSSLPSLPSKTAIAFPSKSMLCFFPSPSSPENGAFTMKRRDFVAGSMLAAGAIAAPIAFLLGSAAAFITGQVIHVDGGMTL